MRLEYAPAVMACEPLEVGERASTRVTNSLNLVRVILPSCAYLPDRRQRLLFVFQVQRTRNNLHVNMILLTIF
jgi:hypothetical protein